MLEVIINMDHQVININMGVAIVMYTRVRLCAEVNGSTPYRVIHSKWTAPTTPNGNILNTAIKFVSPLRPITLTAGWPSVSLKPLPWYKYCSMRIIYENMFWLVGHSTTYFHVVCLSCLFRDYFSLKRTLCSVGSTPMAAPLLVTCGPSATPLPN